MNKKPIIAITMGDAAGIGPEVIAAALKNQAISEACWPLLFGSAEIMAMAMKLTGNLAELHVIEDIAQMTDRPASLNVLDLHNLTEKDLVVGELNAACGKAAAEYILKAAELAMQGQVAAMVTAPINKEAMRLGGYGELGHLELLARYTGVKDYATMLVSENLRVVHLTTHYSLKEAVDRVKKDLILSRLTLTHKSFKQWGYANPVIGVAALNPHGGEGGILGREEIEEIQPAVIAAKDLGIEARGPYPADTIFNRALKGEFDAVIALYHDQGHIPIKVHNVDKSISIALGLPFIRTSVDHGTAFDIAWQGKAEAISMQEAIWAAIRLVNNKHL